MSKKILGTAVVLASILFSGCSNKNLLMPGQEKSDCELNSGTHGVCGSPKSIYNKKNEIDGLGKGTDQAYFVHDDGTIQEISNGVLGDEVKVIIGSDGKKIAVKKDSEDDSLTSTREGVVSQNTKGLKGTNLVVSDNSYVFGEQQKDVVIRNQEVIREAWINTYTDRRGNLILDHRIMIVTKEASWAVGEETPKNVKKAKFIPSRIAKEILIGSNRMADPKDDIKLKRYEASVPETPEADKILRDYLKGK